MLQISLMLKKKFESVNLTCASLLYCGNYKVSLYHKIRYEAVLWILNIKCNLFLPLQMHDDHTHIPNTIAECHYEH